LLRLERREPVSFARSPAIIRSECGLRGQAVKSNFRLGRRRSQRVTLCVPVVVSEPQSNHGRPLERTHTLAVSRYGGLLVLRASVNWGQSLLLTNTCSRVSQECRVVYLGPGHHDKRQVGIEFMGPVANFWNISFPAPAVKPEAIAN